MLLRRRGAPVQQANVDPKLVHAFAGDRLGALAVDAARRVYILATRGVGYRMGKPAEH